MLQLDVNDSENKDEYKDLLFLLLWDSYHKLLRRLVIGISAQFNWELKSMNSDDSKKVLTADFRNVGANDLIVLLDQHPTARYYKNINSANSKYFEENSTVKQHLENAIGAPPSDERLRYR